MALRMSHLEDALIEAGATKETARRAAEEGADFARLVSTAAWGAAISVTISLAVLLSNGALWAQMGDLRAQLVGTRGDLQAQIAGFQGETRARLANLEDGQKELKVGLADLKAHNAAVEAQLVALAASLADIKATVTHK
jgi:hypothetical protein